MAKIRLMTRETKRTAPPQIACGGNISSPACIPRPSNHQARSNVRTYVCTRPTRMCLAASEAYVRTYVRTYTINEVATTALPLHHPRPGNIWEDRSPPRARRPQSPPDSPSTTYVRSSVRPLRTPVSPYVRTSGLVFQRISLVIPHSVGTSSLIITQIDPNYPPRLANLGAGELEQPPLSEYVRRVWLDNRRPPNEEGGRTGRAPKGVGRRTGRHTQGVGWSRGRVANVKMPLNRIPEP